MYRSIKKKGRHGTWLHSSQNVDIGPVYTRVEKLDIGLFYARVCCSITPSRTKSSGKQNLYM